MALKHISVFMNNRKDKDGSMNKTFDIQIVNITALGDEEEADMEAMDIDDLKMLKSELERSIHFEKTIIL